MGNSKAIAARLTDLCQQHRFVQAYQELFAADAVSIDPIYKHRPLKGLDNLIRREEKFLAGIQLKEVNLSAPIFAGNYFSLVFFMQFTAGGDHRTVEEIALYQVSNDKIISQQFFIS